MPNTMITSTVVTHMKLFLTAITMREEIMEEIQIIADEQVTHV